MASLSASLLFSLLLSACGSGGGVGLADPAGEIPGAIPRLPLPSVPLEVPIADLVVDPGTEPGSVVLRFTSPGDASGAAADAYRISTSVRHFSEATLDRATSVPVSASPSPPGTAEAIPVSGLAPGRTLVFGVQAVRSGTAAPLGLTASGRATGRDVPALPANAIPLTGPATLNQSGATYHLTRNVTASGTAFRITARDVTLDLGGHTVTYGTGGARAYGVQADAPSGGNGHTTVRNGRIVQGGGTGTWSHAVVLEQLHDARAAYLTIDVHGPDATGIWVAEADGTVRIDHCDVACRTRTVSNRHYPGVSAIFVEQMTGALEIDQNRITATPQWGIQVEGRSSSHPCLIHHNRVLGTRALVANGYMIGVHKPDADVFENDLHGESRGIHVDEVDTSGRNAWIHDNHLDVQDQPNPEYPDRHWVHGIKIEAANGCRVEHNRIRGVADPSHGDVFGIDITQGEARGISVRHNVVDAVSLTPTLEARAVNWTYGASGSAANDLVVDHNVFQATDTLLYHDWDGGRGGFCRSNWWEREESQGSAHAFRFEYFGNGTEIEAKGRRLLDPFSTTSVLAVEQWASPGSYASTREWTMTIVARAGATALPGASVQVRDRSGTTVFSATTDTAGRARGTVLGTLVERGPTFTTANPHTITVSKSGMPTWQGTRTVEGRTAVIVDLAATSAADDREPPPPPVAAAHALAASRAFVWWTAPDDASGVPTYLVFLDGRPAGITNEQGIFLSGLSAGRSYVVTVEAMDAAGGRSSPSNPVPFTTRPEDRGP